MIINLNSYFFNRNGSIDIEINKRLENLSVLNQLIILDKIKKKKDYWNDTSIIMRILKKYFGKI